MSLDPQLWQRLEYHGVTEEHFQVLLSLLDVQRNGSFTWHFVHGQVGQLDARLTFPSRRLELSRVAQALGGLPDGASIVR